LWESNKQTAVGRKRGERGKGKGKDLQPAFQILRQARRRLVAGRGGEKEGGKKGKEGKFYSCSPNSSCDPLRDRKESYTKKEKKKGGKRGGSAKNRQFALDSLVGRAIYQKKARKRKKKVISLLRMPCMCVQKKKKKLLAPRFCCLSKQEEGRRGKRGENVWMIETRRRLGFPTESTRG